MLNSARRVRWATPRFRKGASTVVSFAALALVLAGCTAEPDVQIKLPERNVDAWVMPLDEFKWVGVSRSNYAELVLIRPCMLDAGLPFDLPPWEERERSESFNDFLFKVNNEELSAKWGYRLAPSEPSQYATEWEQLDSGLTALPEADYAIFVGCREAARKELPIMDDVNNYAASLQVAAYEEALETDSVKGAIESWQECMALLGVPDLPGSPDEMPSPSQTAAFALDDPASPVTQEERDAAVADSACRRSSGYRDAMYDASWDAQVVLLEENSDTLFRNRDILQEHYAKVTEIMNDYVSSS